MHYRDNIGLENKNREYKLFNFNPLKISIEDGKKYLASGVFCFNDSVEETLANYIQIYLPKYLCSFFNPMSYLTNAELYFGINDDGKVIGIPYIGIITEDFINHQIDKILSTHVKFQNLNAKNKIRNLIKVEVIEVKKTNIHNTHKKTYLKYLNESGKIKSDTKIYKKKKDVWNKMFDFNNPKLFDMINDLETRKYIWKYIKIKNKYSIKKFKNEYSHLEPYCDVDNYWNLMAKIKSNNVIKPLKLGSMQQVSNNNLEIYKWVAMWKDSKIAMLKKIKPHKPIKKINSYYPIFLLSQVQKMIPEWIKKNNDLNVYVIKITFEINDNCEFLEYLDNENKWKYSYRTISNGEPVSFSYYSNS